MFVFIQLTLRMTHNWRNLHFLAPRSIKTEPFWIPNRLLLYKCVPKLLQTVFYCTNASPSCPQSCFTASPNCRKPYFTALVPLQVVTYLVLLYGCLPKPYLLHRCLPKMYLLYKCLPSCLKPCFTVQMPPQPVPNRILLYKCNTKSYLLYKCVPSCPKQCFTVQTHPM